MSDFNKISVNSTLSVTQANQATLCFSDGKILANDKYSIANSQVNLIDTSLNTLSVYFNNGVANTYLFRTGLYEPNTTLPNIDINGTPVELNQVLVFIDGELQLSSAYTIIPSNNNNNGGTITFTQPYSDTPDKTFEIVIYSSKVNFIRNSYNHDEIFNLVKRDQNNAYSVRNEQDFLLSLPVVYDKANTLLFINGVQVPFNAIQKDIAEPNVIKLNIKETLNEIEYFEIVKFVNNNTTSVNFTTSFGYLTYGPYDDFNVKIPKLYNLILKFKDQTKLLIDDLRPGFILYSKLCNGIAVIVDTNYENQQLKAIQIQPFSYYEFTKDQYYIEVPETTSILNYLSVFDKRYTFLPEILSCFQRILLDELQDSIQRLKNSRSIQKVDSSQINNLLKLLGFDGNIKTLTHKQRRELIEELTEFYRIVGTRNSYNLVNILQNDLKLINMKQLFTPLGSVNKSKRTIWSYNTKIDTGNGGSGYKVGDYLRAITDRDPIDIIVTDVDGNGSIKEGARIGYTQETLDGYTETNGDFPLESGISAFFNISTPNTTYDYDWSIRDDGNVNFSVGQKFTNHTNKYSLIVDEVDSNGKIIRFTPNPKSGYNRISLSALDFYLNHSNILQLKVTASHIEEDKYLIGEWTTGGQGINLVLEPGTYLIEVAGAGGAGAAGDSRYDIVNDIKAYNGYNGELKTIYKSFTSTTTITGKVGQGGGKVFAMGHGGTNAETKGSGYHDGKMGMLYHEIGFFDYYPTYFYAGGQGGGSSGIEVEGETIIEARGGNGGDTEVSIVAQLNAWIAQGGKYDENYVYDRTTVKSGWGGDGGGGGYNIAGGQGGKGGKGTQPYGSFWSEEGKDGWIKIWRLKHSYSFEITGDTSGVIDNEQFFTVDTLPSGYKETISQFIATAHKNGSATYWDYTPSKGWYPFNNTYTILSKANPKIIVDIDSHFIKNNYKIELLGDIAYMKIGDVFKNNNTDPSKNFTYTITEIDRSINKVFGIFSPMSGIDYLNITNEPASVDTGTNGILTVNSLRATQKNEDRCYIDFYTQDELIDPSKGEGIQKEYRINQTNYGYINEGTPNSPYFWQVGFPDIDYGNISDTPETVIDYGLITDKIEGTWLEWVKWDRGSQWYPTNHVNLEMKLPAGVDFNSYIDTFVEQFYNLASTVVFIQTIIESFYFGKDITGNTTENATTENNGACFGIVTGAPVSEEVMTVSSDPLLQYEEVLQPCQFTVVPTPANATVSIYQNRHLLVEGIGSQTTEVDPTKPVGYRVRVAGSSDYIPHINIVNITTDTTKYVILEEVNPTPNDSSYYDVTVNALPENSSIILQIPDYPLIKAVDTVTLKVPGNTKVKYTVEKEGYIPETDIYLITSNTTLDISLNPEE